MIASSYQVNEPVAEESGEKAEDNAEGDIEPEHEEVSGGQTSDNHLIAALTDFHWRKSRRW